MEESARADHDYDQCERAHAGPTDRISHGDDAAGETRDGRKVEGSVRALFSAWLALPGEGKAPGDGAPTRPVSKICV